MTFDYLNAPPDEQLAYTIAYALERSPFGLKKGNTNEVLRIVGRNLVKHTKECGWHFEYRTTMKPDLPN